MAIEIEQPSVGLSKVAVSETHGEDSPYFAGWKAYDENPYDELTNPSGVIQMGLAENQVSMHKESIKQLLQKQKEETFLLLFLTSYNLQVNVCALLLEQVSFDLLEAFLETHSEASGWGKGASGFRENALFQDYHGLLSFRKAMASFMEQIRGGRAKFDPERVVLTAGATAANELLTFILADPGDALLVPTPYYPG